MNLCDSDVKTKSKGDILLSGFKQNESQFEVSQATSYVEKWLESTKEEYSIDDIKRELREKKIVERPKHQRVPLSRKEIKKEIIGEWCYICFHCGFFIEDLKILRKHIKRKHVRTMKFIPENVISFKIENQYSDKDDKYFYSLEELNFPGVKFTRKVKKYKGTMCPHCDYRPTSNRSLDLTKLYLKRHITEIHTHVARFSCDKCEYAASRKEGLDFHILSKHKTKEQYRFSCALCDYQTYKKSLLKCHSICKHAVGKKCPRHRYRATRVTPTPTSEELIKCDLCDYTTHARHNYKSHYQYRHSKEKPFPCKLCPHRATKLGDLKSHMRSIHTKERPYVCPHCDYSSNKSSHLTSHVRRKHTFYKPHLCPHCDFSAVVPGDLRRHISLNHSKAVPKPKVKLEPKEETFSDEEGL